MTLSFRHLLTVVAMLFALGVRGQDTVRVKGQIGFGTGYVYNAIRSEVISPLKQTGSSMPLHVYYRLEGNRDIFFVRYSYSSISLSSAYKELIASQTSNRMDVAYHRRLNSGSAKVSIWGGVVLGLQIFARTYSSPSGNGSASNDNVKEYYASLSPSLLMERKVPHGSVALQMWASALAYATYPKYALGLTESSVVSTGTYRTFESRLSYVRHLSKRWDARIDGQFQFYSLETPQAISQANLQLISSLVFKL